MIKYIWVQTPSGKMKRPTGFVNVHVTGKCSHIPNVSTIPHSSTDDKWSVMSIIWYLIIITSEGLHNSSVIIPEQHMIWLLLFNWMCER